jgi:hypothetical protein
MTNRYLASIADDGQLMIWQLPEYPQPRNRNTGSNANSVSNGAGGGGGGSTSPVKRERDRDGTSTSSVGEDYQFEIVARHLVHKWQVVDESPNTRMSALDWSKDEIEGELLIAA